MPDRPNNLRAIAILRGESNEIGIARCAAVSRWNGRWRAHPNNSFLMFKPIVSLCRIVLLNASPRRLLNDHGISLVLTPTQQHKLMPNFMLRLLPTFHEIQGVLAGLGT